MAPLYYFVYVLILKVTNTKVNCVEPSKRRTSFLESITSSAVEEANTKSRKRQGSDPESKYHEILWTIHELVFL